ncbi:MAG: PQQ-like beta-propeller repeat protein [bacterium]|nr:PQQ-like beta-propeller repeat protein [bacterium]
MATRRKSLCSWLGWTMMGLALPAALLAQEWPQWRGPNRDGVASGFTVPESWPEKPQRVWQTAVGSGYSGPVTAGGTIYLLSREGDEEVVQAFTLSDGKPQWRQSYPASFRVSQVASAHGKGPKSTPVVADGKLYTLGISGTLSCFDASTGKRRWQKDFSDEFKNTWPIYGTGMSPIVVGDLLIAHVGGPRDGALIAFDASSGEVRWRNAEDGPSYASPIVVELQGQRQLVTMTERHIVGVDLGNGRQLWSVPYKTGYDENIVTPVLYGDKLIFSGVQKSTLAYEVKRDGERWTPREVWSSSQVPIYMSSPVLVGNRLFGMSHKDKGRFFALDAATGKTLWITEGRQGEYASIASAGGVLLILTGHAQLWVLPADADDFAPLARYKVADSPTWAHLALTERGILIRDQSSLALWSF